MLDRVGMRSLNETNKTMGHSCGDAPATGRTVRPKESAFPGGRAYVDPLARTAPIRSGRLRRYRCALDEHPNGNGATIFRGVGGTRGRFGVIAESVPNPTLSADGGAALDFPTDGLDPTLVPGSLATTAAPSQC